MTDDHAGLVERVALIISGQDENGWHGLPENHHERLFGGKWRESQCTRDDYREDAKAVLAALPDFTRRIRALEDALRPFTNAAYGRTMADGREALAYPAGTCVMMMVMDAMAALDGEYQK